MKTSNRSGTNPKIKSPALEAKRIFLIASVRTGFIELCRTTIKDHLFGGTVYVASDGLEALFKAGNVIPHVAIVDANLPKMDGFEVAKKLLETKKPHMISVILVSDFPEDERFVDEVVTGQVQFLRDNPDQSVDLLRMLSRGLNHVSENGNSTYRLRFLAPNETLFSEGDEAHSVYFVKKGELRVSRLEGSPSAEEIGTVRPGEFVGEMAHFNGEPRSATVIAMEPCELIEIPCELFDRVLFSKPAWAKALMETLSRRLKLTNERKLKQKENVTG